ncbi:MAG: hypothetical protein ACLTTW_06560 [Coprobacter sp.]
MEENITVDRDGRRVNFLISGKIELYLYGARADILRQVSRAFTYDTWKDVYFLPGRSRVNIIGLFTLGTVEGSDDGD